MIEHHLRLASLQQQQQQRASSVVNPSHPQPPLSKCLRKTLHLYSKKAEAIRNLTRVFSNICKSELRLLIVCPPNFNGYGFMLELYGPKPRARGCYSQAT